MHLWVSPLEDREQLLRAPEGVAPAKLEDRLGDLDRRLVRAAFRAARALLQAGRALFLEALDPLVTSRPAHAVAAAGLRQGERATLIGRDEQALLIHG
jgi:hypothetical protein